MSSHTRAQNAWLVSGGGADVGHCRPFGVVLLLAFRLRLRGKYGYLLGRLDRDDGLSLSQVLAVRSLSPRRQTAGLHPTVDPPQARRYNEAFVRGSAWDEHVIADHVFGTTTFLQHIMQRFFEVELASASSRHEENLLQVLGLTGAGYEQAGGTRVDPQVLFGTRRIWMLLRSRASADVECVAHRVVRKIVVANRQCVPAGLRTPAKVVLLCVQL